MIADFRFRIADYGAKRSLKDFKFMTPSCAAGEGEHNQ